MSVALPEQEYYPVEPETLASRPSVPCQEIDGVFYPYVEDGEPVVQSDWHSLTLVNMINKTRGLLSSRPEARIFSDVLLYWIQGNNRKKYAPDLYVFPTIEERGRERKAIYLWRERSRPIFVLEVLSDRTMHMDFGPKFEVYQDEIQIPEYFLCTTLPGAPWFWGYRLKDGEYETIEPDEHRRLWSEQLNGWFGVDEHGRLQVWDASGHPVPGYDEALRGREQALRRAEAAEARVRELEEKLKERETRGQGEPGL